MGLFSFVGKAVGGIVKAGVSAVTGGAVQLGSKPRTTSVPFVGNPTTLGPNESASGGFGGQYRSDLGNGNLGRIQTTEFDVLNTLALTGAIEARYNSGGDLNAALAARALDDDGPDASTGALLALAGVTAVGVVVSLAARR